MSDNELHAKIDQLQKSVDNLYDKVGFLMELVLKLQLNYDKQSKH